MSSTKFPLFHLEGTPQEIGLQHGKLLADRIRQNIEFYRGIFSKTEQEIFSLARCFEQNIQEFQPDYSTEIEGVASGAEVHPLWIYALNARTEILSLDAQECTSAYFRQTRLLGQNWDWAKKLEEISVLLEIRKTGAPALLMIAEPGIIGKMGLNSLGLGACMNILRVDKKLDGVPFHVLIRAVLDSRNIEEAKEKVNQAGTGKASNLLVADSEGNAFDIEFAGDETFPLEMNHPVFLHTNHYLGKEVNPKGGSYQSTTARLDKAHELADNFFSFSIEEMKKIFLDRSNQENPICREYVRYLELEDMGTVCSVIMDLPKRTLHLTQGTPLENPFKEFTLK